MFRFCLFSTVKLESSAEVFTLKPVDIRPAKSLSTVSSFKTWIFGKPLEAGMNGKSSGDIGVFVVSDDIEDKAPGVGVSGFDTFDILQADASLMSSVGFDFVNGWDVLSGTVVVGDSKMRLKLTLWLKLYRDTMAHNK